MTKERAQLIRRVSSSLTELKAGTIYHRKLRWALDDIKEIWHPRPRPNINCAPPFFDPSKPATPAPPPPTKRPPPWYLGMSSNFTKDVTKIDRRLQGRILEALADITKSPTKIRGDTVKPLTGDLNGCWRYRIGDYRLIYSPNRSSGDVTLLAFAPRAAAYEE